MSDLELPERYDSQSLHWYVRTHLDRIEYLRWAGIPYPSLARALNSLGFEAVGVRTLQTAVYRARHGTCKKGATAAAMRGIGQVGRIYMGQRLKDRAELERKLGRLQWPNPPGERDPGG